MTDTVLVTGVSGFIGSYVAAGLLRRGYAVRGTVRSLARADEVRAAMTEAGADPGRLEFRELDLLSDEGWAEAVAGSRFVLHVASPFFSRMPKDPDELIRPAVEGTRRVLGAALDAGVQRVVVTASLAAIQHAPAGRGHVFTASDWTDPNLRGLSAYAVSKVLAERAAWDLVDRRGERERLAMIHPGMVIGPPLSEDPGTSVAVIQQIMAGALPMIPDLRMPWVHVQDVADAHIEAMTSPAAAGARTIVSTDSSSLIDVAAVLRARLPEQSARLPRWGMPGWLTWIASVFEPQLRGNRSLIGMIGRFERGPAERLLGRPLRSIPETIEETGRGLVARGLI